MIITHRMTALDRVPAAEARPEPAIGARRDRARARGTPDSALRGGMGAHLRRLSVNSRPRPLEPSLSTTESPSPGDAFTDACSARRSARARGWARPPGRPPRIGRRGTDCGRCPSDAADQVSARARGGLFGRTRCTGSTGARVRAGESALSICRALCAGWVGAAHRSIHGSLRTVTQRSPTWAAHVGHGTSRCFRLCRAATGTAVSLPGAPVRMSAEAGRDIVTIKVKPVAGPVSRTFCWSVLC